MKLKIETWDAECDGELTEVVARSLHEPAWHYRFSMTSVEAGTDFTGVARACTIYVLRGACRLRWSEFSAELLAGQFMSAPAGRYDFAVLGPNTCEILRVFLLPPEVRPQPPVQRFSGASSDANPRLGELPEIREVFRVARNYLDGMCSIHELNGVAEQARDAARISGAAPAIIAVLDDWRAMINRRWNEMGTAEQPLSEHRFAQWLREQLL